ncbi:MAG: hypothetical protein G01um101420_755 [Parcubacteria group bacterium Gr01-1014_20]|nr:MAG: hypothetical protein G01um101420_755 [Parcubacteria group bacterium Gr01-1014_20]
MKRSFADSKRQKVSKNQKVVLIVTILIAAPLAVFLFLHQVGSRSLSRQSGASAAANIPTTNVAIAAATSPAEKVPIYEVHIANNGIILLRDARVISIIGNDIRVGMKWDRADFSWRVRISPSSIGTAFVEPKNGKAGFEDIQVGDLITVTGKITSSGAEPIIDAQFVRL